MSKQQDEVGLTEIAKILECSRASAYIYVKSHDIEGSRFVANRLWTAPRSAVERFKLERARNIVQPLAAA